MDQDRYFNLVEEQGNDNTSVVEKNKKKKQKQKQKIERAGGDRSALDR